MKGQKLQNLHIFSKIFSQFVFEFRARPNHIRIYSEPNIFQHLQGVHEPHHAHDVHRAHRVHHIYPIYLVHHIHHVHHVHRVHHVHGDHNYVRHVGS